MLTEEQVVKTNRHDLEKQLSETKSQLRGLFVDFAQRPKTWRRGLQHLGDVKPVDELRRGLRRLTSLNTMRSLTAAEPSECPKVLHDD